MTWGSHGAAESSDAGSWRAKEGTSGQRGYFWQTQNLSKNVVGLANQNALGGQCLTKCLTFCWVRLGQIVLWGCSQNTTQNPRMQTVGTVYRENRFIDEANTTEGRFVCCDDLGKEVNRQTLVKATIIQGLWSTQVISGKDKTIWC